MRGYYERHLRSVLRSYRRRRDLMCSLLDRHLPRGCGFSRPQGGFSVWLRLPPGWSSGRLLPLPSARGLTLDHSNGPGRLFCPAEPV